jgi:DNA processing protein
LTLSFLDPQDPDPDARAALGAWLAFQREFAWKPEAAAVQLAALPPGSVLPGARWRRSPVSPAVVDLLAEGGGVGVPFPSSLYPEPLRRLRDAPPLLWVRGSPEALAGPCIAVVGPRVPSAYGRHVARSVAAALATLGAVIVSGLARGIDAEAHEAALEVGGRTVAFQACGPDRVHPKAHRELADRIAASGAVVSELPAGVAPRRPHFPLRNRLISGVSRAVVVVEARVRSGSLTTARHAADQNVPVLAVPGPITAPTSGGTNLLLRDGATPLLRVADVLDAAKLEVCQPAALKGRRHRGLAGRVRTALLRAALDRDELSAELACSSAELAVVLLELELEGSVVVDPRDGRLRWLTPIPGARPGPGRRGLSSAAGSGEPWGEN